MKIRPANLTDVPALNHLVNSAYRGESSRAGWTTEADLLDGIRTTESQLELLVQQEDAVILVAEENGELLACVYLDKKGEALYLGMLTVNPFLQGKGLGATLLYAAEQQAKDWQCTAIQMTVITARKSLIAYYNRKGFYDTGFRQPFPDDPAFGIPKQPLQFMVMEKKLSHQ